MGEVITLPARGQVTGFGPEERRTLDRLVERFAGAGAVGWEVEEGRAYIVGAEEETLLIVAKGTAGIAVLSGYAHRLLWQGDGLTGFT